MFEMHTCLELTEIFLGMIQSMLISYFVGYGVSFYKISPLPDSTLWFNLIGKNHSKYFRYYGENKKDLERPDNNLSILFAFRLGRLKFCLLELLSRIATNYCEANCHKIGLFLSSLALLRHQFSIINLINCTPSLRFC